MCAKEDGADLQELAEIFRSSGDDGDEAPILPLTLEAREPAGVQDPLETTRAAPSRV